MDICVSYSGNLKLDKSYKETVEVLTIFYSWLFMICYDLLCLFIIIYDFLWLFMIIYDYLWFI